MVDTVRTLAALQALLADNVAGDISAQDVRDMLVSVMPPQYSGCRVTDAGTEALADITEVTIAFDTERLDTDNYHDTAVNNSRLTIPTDGLYIVGANIGFSQEASHQSHVKRLRFLEGGATEIARVEVISGGLGIEVLQLVTVDLFAADDYVEVLVIHSSGETLNTVKGANYSPEFWIARLGQTPV